VIAASGGTGADADDDDEELLRVAWNEETSSE
jgi:hypothetical protein